MPAAADTAEPNRIEIVLDYVEEELARFDALMTRQKAAEARPKIWEGWPAFIVLGFAVAIGAALLAISGGSIAVRSGAGIAALAFAAYWIGITAPALVADIAAKRQQKATYDAFRTEWNGTRLLATPSGIWFRREGLRSFIGKSAIQAVTCTDGLLLLHLSAGQPTMIPLRLLTPKQQAKFIALTDTAGEVGARANSP